MTPERDLPSIQQPGHPFTGKIAASAWLALSLLWLAYLLNYADRQAIFSILPALERDLHVSDAQLGLIGSLFTWSYALSMPLTGMLADRVGRRKIVVSSVILWSGATLGTALSYSLAQFLLMRVLMGVTEALYVPAAYGLLGAIFPQRLRSRVLALHGTAQFAGIAAGSSYGGWMADHPGWRIGFEWAAIVGAIYGALLFVAMRSLLVSEPERIESTPFSLAPFRSRRLLCLIAAFFTFCLLLWMIYAWLPLFIYDRFHLSMTQSGTITSLLQIGAVFGVFLGGFLGDYFGCLRSGTRAAVAGVGLLLCAPFGWLMFSVTSLSLLRSVMVIFGLLSGLFIANIFAAALDYVRERNYSFVTAVVNMAGGAAGGFGILLVGFFKAEIGTSRIVAAASVLVAASAIPLLVTSFRRPAAIHR